MLFIEGSDSFLRPIIPEVWKLLVFWIKKREYKKTLKIFSTKNKSFHDVHKVSKSTVANTMTIEYLTKATIRNLSIKILSKISHKSRIRVLIYRLDIYNLQTKIVSFPDQEKLLKEVVFKRISA